MRNEWKSTSLREACLNVSYGYTESASEEKVGPQFLRITDIQGGTVNWKNVPFCPINEENRRKYRLEVGDIVIARTGNSTGENYLFTESNDSVFASYLIRFKVDQTEHDPAFVWYNLRSRKWWHFVNGFKTGSAQAGANAKTLGMYEFKYPSLPEQKAIAHILGTLDDKIELNRQMNETLEEMAQALFKSWFVDFDPVIDKALAAGNEIPEPLQKRAQQRQALGDNRKPLPDHIRDLFPDRFTFTEELGWIPEGWEVKKICDVGKVITGKTPSSKNPEEFGEIYPFVTPTDFKNYHKVILSAERRLSETGREKNHKRMLPTNTVLVSCIGSDMGKVMVAKVECASNQQINALIPNEGMSSEFLYFYFKNSYELLRQLAFGGSTMPILNKSEFENLGVLTPSGKILEQADVQYLTFDQRIVRNTEENQILNELRNTLLPKLISGELRVPEAEQIIAEQIIADHV